MPSGKLADGTSFSGTCRTAYLPDTPEGRIVFKMFVEAFKRRLTFLVGTSLTTAQTDCVVWAGLHHKTTMHGKPFGYPDPTYLSRVTEELKARNIDAEQVKDMKINTKKGRVKV